MAACGDSGRQGTGKRGRVNEGWVGVGMVGEGMVVSVMVGEGELSWGRGGDGSRKGAQKWGLGG